MKQNLSAILFFSILVYCCSCSKNSDHTPTPVIPNLNTTLLKVYEIDTTKSISNDTLSRWSFTYDNSNRIIIDSFTSIKIYASRIYTDIKTFDYNGSDSFAARMIQSEFTSSSFLSSDTTFYKFINGKYDSDSAIYNYGSTSPGGTSEANFIYQPGIVIKNFRNSIPQYSYSDIELDTIHQTISNGNIVSQIDTLKSITNGQNSGSQIFSNNVSYLPNTNPFYQTNFPIQKSYFHTIGIGNLISENGGYVPQRLISQQTSTLILQQTSTMGNITYNYTFRSDGYPLTANVTLDDNGTMTITKLVFVYKSN